MYSEDYDGANAQERSGEDIYSKPVRAGKRTYFFDVKATKGNDYYLTITESKRKVDNNGHFAYDKHKIFLYKEDFEKFAEGLEEVIAYIRKNCLKDGGRQAGDNFTRIFEEEFVDSEELEQILEEKSLFWNEDLPYALTWCCKTFKGFAKGEAWTLIPLYQSEMIKGEGVESDKYFVRKLLQASFAGYEKYSGMVAESVSGWEKERLFSTDVVLIVMGLAEIVTFPTIPVKVSINEYVEISKFYGTPKSRSFVNGLLDRLVQTLVNEGQVAKEGKGLM